MVVTGAGEDVYRKGKYDVRDSLHYSHFNIMMKTKRPLRRLRTNIEPVSLSILSDLSDVS